MDRAPTEQSSPLAATPPLLPPISMQAPPREPPVPAPAVDGRPIDVDAFQEIDVWWGSYSVRGMWPSLAICLLLTAAAGIVAMSLYHANPEHPALARYAAYGLAGGIWLVQLLRVGYRTVGITYRLTNYRLFRDRGFGNPSAGWADLSRLTAADVERGVLERPVGVGRIVVRFGDKEPPLVLLGIYKPEIVAELIGKTAAKARRIAHPAADQNDGD